MRYPLRSKQPGFTLLELMITLVVLAVLAGIAAPSFFNLIRDTQLDAAASDISSSFRYARSLSIERNDTITVRPLTAGTGFAQGWGVYDSTPTLLRQYDSLDITLSCTGTPTEDCRVGVAFSPRGTSQPATFTVCDDRGQGRRVTVLLSGGVRVVSLDGC